MSIVRKTTGTLVEIRTDEDGLTTVELELERPVLPEPVRLSRRGEDNARHSFVDAVIEDPRLVVPGEMVEVEQRDDGPFVVRLAGVL